MNLFINYCYFISLPSLLLFIHLLFFLFHLRAVITAMGFNTEALLPACNTSLFRVICHNVSVNTECPGSWKWLWFYCASRLRWWDVMWSLTCFDAVFQEKRRDVASPLSMSCQWTSRWHQSPPPVSWVSGLVFQRQHWLNIYIYWQITKAAKH